MLTVDGVDDSALNLLRQSIVAAGANVAGVVTLTDRMALSSPADVAKLQEIVGSSTTDPTTLRVDLAARLGTLVTAVADSRPVHLDPPPPPEGEPGAAVQPGPTTTTIAFETASMAASATLRQFLSDLADAGFVKINDQPDGADSLDLGGLRLVVMSGDGAKVDNSLFLYPFLQRMVGGAEPSTLAVEATRDGSTVPRGSFVGPIRGDGNLRDHVSTVDDAEWFVGRAAAVMALHDLVAGNVGHYGVGDGASDLLPSSGTAGSGT